jgi:hypothetical protein
MVEMIHREQVFKLLVAKNSQMIVISLNGKRLIIKKGDKLFEKFNKMSKEEIIQWYQNRK